MDPLKGKLLALNIGIDSPMVVQGHLPVEEAMKALHPKNLVEKLGRIALPGHRDPDRDIHLGEPGFLSKLLRRRKLESLFLFVTSRCNSNCRTCFYASELNQGEDMSFAQIERISQTAPKFDKLWLSGGEPFMRKDLMDIIELFYRNNGVRAINLPTNGLLGDRVETEIERLLHRCPELTVHLNFSLDGLGDTHDAIRGVPGSFGKTEALMDRLQDRYGDNPRLIRNVATVITREAMGELLDLGTHLLDKRNCSVQFFETVRGDPRDPQVKDLKREELEALHDQLMPLYEPMAERLFGQIPVQGRWFAKLYFLGVIRFAYALQEANIDGPSEWGMDCTAGETTLVVDHDGRFRSCEMRPPIGRLQDFDFDLNAVLGSDVLKTEVALIGGGKRANCWCTHTCWVLSSMKFSPTTLLFRIPMAWLRYRMSRPAGPGLGRSVQA